MYKAETDGIEMVRLSEFFDNSNVDVWRDHTPLAIDWSLELHVAGLRNWIIDKMFSKSIGKLWMHIVGVGALEYM